MQGIERTTCDVCINAVIGAWRTLMESSAAEALQEVKYGKGDTLGLDATTEIIISSRLMAFDKHAIFITEELDDNNHRRWPTDGDPDRQPLMFFSDPTDGSIELQKFIAKISKKHPVAKIGKLMSKVNVENIWAKVSGQKPAAVTGSTTSITCIRKGKAVFSVILNLMTGTIYVACDLGVYWYKLKDYTNNINETLTLSNIVRSGKKLVFPSIRERGFSADECKRFVTFLGKPGYKENFKDSMLFVEKPDNYLHHKRPPGPPRPLYLSELQPQNAPIGFVMANGEKIGEWIPWMSFVKYAQDENRNKALKAFEISLPRPWTKNGMLMSTTREYSLFCGDDGGMYLDMSRLRSFDRPSQFRSMIVVLPTDNEWIIHVLRQHEYREITDAF